MKLPFLALLALALSGCASLERSRSLGDPRVAAATLARQVCSNCHGLTGDSVSPVFPKLAGQPEAYLAAQLNGFRAQSRRDPAGYEYMWGLSRQLSDEQVGGLAAYYAAQVPGRAATAADPALREAGRSVFEAGIAERNVPACVACHGSQGQGQAAFPRLAGQHADYLAKQLGVFKRSDDRPEGSVMKTIAHGLDERDIEAVAAYLAAL